MEFWLVLMGLVAVAMVVVHVKEQKEMTSEKKNPKAECPVIKTRREELELKILRNLANHYAENGYSKAIKVLKEIEGLKEAQKGNPKTLDEVV